MRVGLRFSIAVIIIITGALFLGRSEDLDTDVGVDLCDGGIQIATILHYDMKFGMS